ncbi:MAG: phytanoyl-CoA dioxygenase [Phycisphaeraceae bacterium]|nr:phytanoyl-CoA dioxygenase [Phycisphaeraceae bacterium]
MTVTFGLNEVELGSNELGTDLRDCNDLLGDAAALRDRMAKDGYLLVRQLHDPKLVLKARTTILAYMRDQTQCIDPNTPLIDGMITNDSKAPNMMGKTDITHHPDVKAVLEGQRVFDFFNTYFGETSRTFDYKWLRAVGKDTGTAAHYDFVYMGRGSERLHTIWTPFGRLTPEQGTLAMLVGSHNLASFEKLRNTYGKSDVDRDGTSGHFTHDLLGIAREFGGQWQTTTFEPGDVILFGMHAMHASTTNTTNQWRISCDTRFQPAADPIDERWVGKNPIGHTHTNPKPNAWQVKKLATSSQR